MKRIRNIVLTLILMLALVITITACDLTEDPQTFTVTFVCAEDINITPGSREVIEGRLVTPPLAIRDGFEIGGWYLDANFEESFDFNTPIVRDKNVYVRWVALQATMVSITFDSDGGSLVDSISVAINTSINAPENPNKPNHIFNGWMLAGQVISFPFEVAQDTTFVASWSEEIPILVFTVTFNTTGGSTIDPQSVNENDNALRPTNPIKDDFVFTNWYIDSELTTLFDFDTPITEDITLYAGWNESINQFEVTFNSNQGEAVGNQVINEGQLAVRPTDPIKEGYLFGNWYIDPEFETLFDFNTPITEDITLYARWDEVVVTFTVTFNSNGGTLIDDQLIVEGLTAQRPTNPTKDDYDFRNWYIDADLTILFDFDTPITKDITLYAGWHKVVVSFTVTFNSNGGSLVDDQLIQDGLSVSRPTDPTKDHHTFAGWYSDYLLTSPFNFDSIITESITLYARWTENEYDITFNFNFTDAPENIVIQTTNRLVEAPDVFMRSGYRFYGWWTSDDYGLTFVSQWEFSTQFSANTQLFARWVSDLSITVQCDTPVLTIEENKVTWHSILFALGYDIRVTDPTGQQHTFERQSHTYFIIPFDMPGVYTIQVRAAGNGTTSINSEWAIQTINYKMLTSPTGFSFSSATDTISWFSVDGATAYIIYIATSNPAYNVIFENIGLATSFSIVHLPAGNITITVEAIRDGYLSAYAEFSLFKMRLAPPIDVKVSSSSVLTWAPVEHADQYEVQINDQRFNVGYELSFAMCLEQLGIKPGQTMTIVVRAGNVEGYFVWSFPSSPIVINIPSLPMLSFDNGILSWCEIDVADGYNVRINGGDVIPLGRLTEKNVRSHITQAQTYLFEVQVRLLGFILDWVAIEVDITSVDVEYDYVFGVDEDLLTWNAKSNQYRIYLNFDFVGTIMGTSPIVLSELNLVVGPNLIEVVSTTVGWHFADNDYIFGYSIGQWAFEYQESQQIVDYNFSVVSNRLQWDVGGAHRVYIYHNAQWVFIDDATGFINIDSLDLQEGQNTVRLTIEHGEWSYDADVLTYVAAIYALIIVNIVNEFEVAHDFIVSDSFIQWQAQETQRVYGYTNGQWTFIRQATGSIHISELDGATGIKIASTQNYYIIENQVFIVRIFAQSDFPIVRRIELDYSYEWFGWPFITWVWPNSGSQVLYVFRDNDWVSLGLVWGEVDVLSLNLEEGSNNVRVVQRVMRNQNVVFEEYVLWDLYYVNADFEIFYDYYIDTNHISWDSSYRYRIYQFLSNTWIHVGPGSTDSMINFDDMDLNPGYNELRFARNQIRITYHNGVITTSRGYALWNIYVVDEASKADFELRIGSTGMSLERSPWSPEHRYNIYRLVSDQWVRVHTTTNSSSSFGFTSMQLEEGYNEFRIERIGDRKTIYQDGVIVRSGGYYMLWSVMVKQADPFEVAVRDTRLTWNLGGRFIRLSRFIDGRWVDMASAAGSITLQDLSRNGLLQDGHNLIRLQPESPLWFENGIVWHHNHSVIWEAYLVDEMEPIFAEFNFGILDGGARLHWNHTAEANVYVDIDGEWVFVSNAFGHIGMHQLDIKCGINRVKVERIVPTWGYYSGVVARNVLVSSIFEIEYASGVDQLDYSFHYWTEPHGAGILSWSSSNSVHKIYLWSEDKWNLLDSMVFWSFDIKPYLAVGMNMFKVRNASDAWSISDGVLVRGGYAVFELYIEQREGDYTPFVWGFNLRWLAESIRHESFVNIHNLTTGERTVHFNSFWGHIGLPQLGLQPGHNKIEISSFIIDSIGNTTTHIAYESRFIWEIYLVEDDEFGNTDNFSTSVASSGEVFIVTGMGNFTTYRWINNEWVFIPNNVTNGISLASLMVSEGLNTYKMTRMFSYAGDGVLIRDSFVIWEFELAHNLSIAVDRVKTIQANRLHIGGNNFRNLTIYRKIDGEWVFIGETDGNFVDLFSLGLSDGLNNFKFVNQSVGLAEYIGGVLVLNPRLYSLWDIEFAHIDSQQIDHNFNVTSSLLSWQLDPFPWSDVIWYDVFIMVNGVWHYRATSHSMQVQLSQLNLVDGQNNIKVQQVSASFAVNNGILQLSNKIYALYSLYLQPTQHIRHDNIEIQILPNATFRFTGLHFGGPLRICVLRESGWQTAVESRDSWSNASLMELRLHDGLNEIRISGNFLNVNGDQIQRTINYVIFNVFHDAADSVIRDAGFRVNSNRELAWSGSGIVFRWHENEWHQLTSWSQNMINLEDLGLTEGLNMIKVQFGIGALIPGGTYENGIFTTSQRTHAIWEIDFKSKDDSGNADVLILPSGISWSGLADLYRKEDGSWELLATRAPNLPLSLIEVGMNQFRLHRTYFNYDDGVLTEIRDITLFEVEGVFGVKSQFGLWPTIERWPAEGIVVTFPLENRFYQKIDDMWVLVGFGRHLPLEQLNLSSGLNSFRIVRRTDTVSDGKVIINGLYSYWDIII